MRAGGGAVYAFTESGGKWLEVQTLTANDAMGGDYSAERSQ
jgi:hypothetical protein